MKIVFLNTWLGRFPDRLESFLREHAPDTDVFCFQEASRDFQALCTRLLPGYEAFVTDKTLLLPEHGRGEPVPHWYVLASYVKRSLGIRERGSLLTEDPASGIVQFFTLPFGTGMLEIVNVHGVSIPGKLDNPDRIRQFASIRDHCESRPQPSVIGGDFNVLPDTESVQMFARRYRDLISEYRIPTTRNRLAWEKHPGNELYYSDYVFADRSLAVRGFAVPESEISDHLPLILELDDSLPPSLGAEVQ